MTLPRLQNAVRSGKKNEKLKKVEFEVGVVWVLGQIKHAPGKTNYP
jgi:hypothetical protein